MAGVDDQQVMLLEAAVIENGNAIRSGSLYGMLVGFALGFTFWTHSMDLNHIFLAVFLTILGLVGGTVIGLVVSKINTDEA